MSGFICSFEDGIWALLGDVWELATMAAKLLMTYAKRHNKVSALFAANAVRIGMR